MLSACFVVRTSVINVIVKVTETQVNVNYRFSANDVRKFDMVIQHIVEKPLFRVYHASILRGRGYSAPNFQGPYIFEQNYQIRRGNTNVEESVLRISYKKMHIAQMR